MIIQSSTYQLLDGKTQMIDEENGREIRSRQEHTNNVADIAKRIISRIYDLCSITQISKTELFQLNKQRAELYAEVTALSHDLGHTPFGHAGEAVVNEFMQSIKDKDVIAKMIEKRRRIFGVAYEENQGHTKNFKGRLSFEHNEQSVIEFSKIVEKSPEDFDEINIEKIVEGILAHSITRVPEVPEDLIAQIIRQTDKIEYRNRDYDEVMGYVNYESDEEELQQYQALPVEDRINKIIEDMADEAIEKGRIDDDNNALKICKKLRNKYENAIYLLGRDGKRGLLTGDNRERQQMICKKLLEYYYQHPEKIPTKTMTYNYPINGSRPTKRVISFDQTDMMQDTLVERTIAYVNTFTNEQCYKQYIRLVKERTVKGQGHGIEPITSKDIISRKKIQIQEQVAKIRAKDMYKGKEAHTDQEYISMLQGKNQRFLENDLTEEGKEVIKQNALKHKKENQEDELLWWIVKKADTERSEKETKGERQSQPDQGLEI